MRALVIVLCALLPWAFRRRVLEVILGYKLHPTCSLSRLSIAFPRNLIMGPNSKVGAFTVCKGLELLEIGEHGSIGRLNHISAVPLSGSRHFAGQTDRKPQLIIGRHAAITNRHIIDCTDSVSIGAFTIFAGARSQILTHAIDLTRNVQRCSPVTIGSYSFIGTEATILAGSNLPGASILGAKSLLNKSYDAEGYLYAGVPARPIKQCSGAYFTRSKGYVW